MRSACANAEPAVKTPPDSTTIRSGAHRHARKARANVEAEPPGRRRLPAVEHAGGCEHEGRRARRGDEHALRRRARHAARRRARCPGARARRRSPAPSPVPSPGSTSTSPRAAAARDRSAPSTASVRPAAVRTGSPSTRHDALARRRARPLRQRGEARRATRRAAVATMSSATPSGPSATPSKTRCVMVEACGKNRPNIVVPATGRTAAASDRATQETR